MKTLLSYPGDRIVRPPALTKRRWTRAAMLFILAVSCLHFSCLVNYSDTVTDETYNLTLYVTLPQQETIDENPQVRSAVGETGTQEESTIETLTFAIFTAAGEREYFNTIEIDPSGESDDPMWDASRQALRITVTPGEKNIYCVANWPVVPTAEMPDLSVMSSAELASAVRSHSSMPVNPPVMSGRIEVNLTGDQQMMEMSLTRQIARVHIFPMISPELAATPNLEVKLLGVKFMRLSAASYLFGKSPASSPGNSVFDGSGFDGVQSPAITALKAEEAWRYDRSYYIPENIASSPEKATYMVLKFLFNGTETYYSIVVNDSGTPHYQRYSIERNHSYAYYITVRGIGEANETDSYPGTRSTAGGHYCYDLLIEDM